MNIKIKKLVSMFLTLALLAVVFPVHMLVSHAATGKITFSDPTVTVGNQVSVTMKISTSDGNLGASDVRLQYDSSSLEFLSGTDANGGAGSIRVLGSMESADQKTFSFTLKFKGLKAGTSSIKIASQEVYDADGRTVTIEHLGSSAVKVVAPETYSKEASLESLTINPGELTPAFSSDVTEYTAIVGADVDKLTVSAPAKDSKASVSVSGNEGLQMGDNTVSCKVTAEDGETTKTYTILVTKTEQLPDESDGTADAPVSAGSAQNIEEGNWQVVDSLEGVELPEGFSVTDFIYNGAAVQAATDATGNILLYMTNENGAFDFFIYDAETNILAPYVTVRMAEKTIIVLPPEEIPEGTVLPSNFANCTIDIGTHTVDGWVWNGSKEAPEYCVVYGQNENGERSFYRYDQKEMTLQRYFEDPDAAELRTKYETVANDYNNLLNDYKVRGWIMVALFAALILLVIILIVVLLLKKPKEYMADEPMEEFVPTERRRAERSKNRYADREEPFEVPVPEERRKVRSVQREESKDNVSVRPVKKEQLNENTKVRPAKREEPEDDDFEFIDLDL